MTNLRNRIKKAEEAHEKMIRKDHGNIFFWRHVPGVPGEREKRFREEHPDFKGEIIGMSFRTEYPDQRTGER
jgi:hypothetical protein